MLGVLGYTIRLTLNNHEIEPVKYGIDDIKVKYTELMAVCELLGINIEWMPIEGVTKNTTHAL